MRLIDADALLESFDVAWMWEYDETGCGVRKKAIPTKTIEEAPTIDAEPVRHGRWITVNTPFGRERECSVCHNRDNPKTAIAGCYCWFCSAKMDGGDTNGI